MLYCIIVWIFTSKKCCCLFFFHLKLKSSQYPAIFDNVSLKPLFFVSTNGSNNALCIHGLSSVCDCELSTPLNREKWLKNTTVACELMAAVIPTLPTGNPSSKYNKKNMISVSQTSAEGLAIDLLSKAWSINVALVYHCLLTKWLPGTCYHEWRRLVRHEAVFDIDASFHVDHQPCVQYWSIYCAVSTCFLGFKCYGNVPA